MNADSVMQGGQVCSWVLAGDFCGAWNGGAAATL